MSRNIITVEVPPTPPVLTPKVARIILNILRDNFVGERSHDSQGEQSAAIPLVAEEKAI